MMHGSLWILILCSIVTVLGELQFANFEQQHMMDAHQIEVSDEVAFFKIHDRNGDGYWDDYELRAMYGFERDVDGSAPHVRTIIDRAFHDLDRDFDGLISLQEYMRSHLPDWTPEEIRQEKQWQEEHKAAPLESRDTSPNEQHSQPEWEDEQEHDEHDDPIPQKFLVNP